MLSLKIELLQKSFLTDCQTFCIFRANCGSRAELIASEAAFPEYLFLQVLYSRLIGYLHLNPSFNDNEDGIRRVFSSEDGAPSFEFKSMRIENELIFLFVVEVVKNGEILDIAFHEFEILLIYLGHESPKSHEVQPPKSAFGL